MGRGPRYDEEKAREAIARSYSWAEALRELGMCPSGGGHAILKKYARRWGISTAHFDPNHARHRLGKARRRPLDDILVRGSTFDRGTLKRRLYEAGLKQRRCELCGQTENWRGKRMALILDHVNGIRDDNRLENLQVVCPNCAATLETHCGRMSRRYPDRRDCGRCGRSFEVKYATHRFCSPRCGTRAPRTSRGVPNPARRKVPRPTEKRLRADVESLGYLATGRKYGVSDNAVRKWLVWYRRERERAAAGVAREPHRPQARDPA
jgi:hypothetical protein